MRDLNSTFVGEKNKEKNQPIWLYIIYDYNGEDDNLYFARATSNITFGGIEYTSFPITHDSISENSEGRIDAVELKIANSVDYLQEYLDTYEWRGKKVAILRVFADHLDDSDAYDQDIFYIDSWRTSNKDVVVVCTGKTNVLDVQLPRGIYLRHHCRWKFKGTECGYSGGETTCNLTKARCKALSNYSRFGGVPSMPTRRNIIS